MTFQRRTRSRLGLWLAPMVFAALLALPAPAYAAAPVAVDGATSTKVGKPVLIGLNAYDLDYDPLTWEVLTPPQHGTTDDCTDGSCTYTPAADFSGADSMTYRVSDGTSWSGTGRLDITVTPDCGRTIDNDRVALGVNCTGELNFRGTGLKFLDTGNESVSPGCECEGWGVADEHSRVSGYANQSYDPSPNLQLVDFTATESGAVSTVRVGDTFEVVHDYQPSRISPLVYQSTVRVTNISSATTDLLYRRVMDWDVEPTAFKEYVTLDQGTSPLVSFTSNDGWARANPFAGRTSRGEIGSFVDSGPSDHGALFDFDFGELAAGDTRVFQIYYGAAPDEVTALDALNDHRVEAYSLGQPGGPGHDPAVGAPNTFFFGFRDIGGSAVFAPLTRLDSRVMLYNTSLDIDVLANDSDPNGDAISIVDHTQGAHGAVSCTTQRCSYTPERDWLGTDAFTYVVTDGLNESVGTVKVSVRDKLNVAPVAGDDRLDLDEDGYGTLDVLANDTDADGDALTVRLLSQPTHGELSCEASECTYLPDFDWSGTDSFTYEVSDEYDATDTATVRIEVAAQPDAPHARNDSGESDEDVPLLVDVLANDTDADGEALEAIVSTDPEHGTVECGVGPRGGCRYTPDPDWWGQDSFTYVAADPTGLLSRARVDVAVSSVKDAPVALDDAARVDEDRSVAIEVLANDSDADGDDLRITGTTTPSFGSVSCDLAQVCTYTPRADRFGTDTFDYTVSDGDGGQDSATVTVTVVGVNDAPVAVADSVDTDEDVPVTVDIGANDRDADGDTLTWSVTKQPLHGTVVCTGSSCRYVPAADWSGTDQLTYKVTDPSGLSATATLTVRVAAVNDAPVAAPDTLTLNEDTPGTVGVLANDTDVEGGTLQVVGSTDGAKGSVVCTTAGSCTYTPTANAAGSDTFTYTVRDPQGATATGTVTVTIRAVNDAPVARADTATTAEDRPVDIAVLGNDSDPDGDALTAVLATAAQHGTVTCGAAGCRYVPAPDWHGTDSFGYRVSDGTTTSAIVTVTVTVTPVDDAPVARDDSDLVDPGGSVVVDVLANDTDADGDALSVVAHGEAGHGQVTCTATGCTYAPAEGYSGADSFTYTVSDPSGLRATATVSMSVALPAPPGVTDDTATTAEDTAVTVPVLANDTTRTGPLAVTGHGVAEHGTVSCAADACTYAPSANWHGTDAFTYTVTDAGGRTSVGTVALTITPVNDVPTAGADALTVKAGSYARVSVLGNDADVDGDPLSVTGAKAARGTVTCTAAGTCTYRPPSGWWGSTSFAYTVSDGRGGTVTGTVAVRVSAAAKPGAPVIKKASSGASGGKATATARWAAPRSNGGSPITGYKVTAYRLSSSGKTLSSKTFSASSRATSLTMTLAKGTYAFKVRAVSKAGIGAYSKSSNRVSAR